MDILIIIILFAIVGIPALILFMWSIFTLIWWLSYDIIENELRVNRLKKDGRKMNK